MIYIFLNCEGFCFTNTSITFSQYFMPVKRNMLFNVNIPHSFISAN